MNTYQPTVTLVPKRRLIAEVSKAIKNGAYVIKIEGLETSRTQTNRKRHIVTVWK